MKKKPKASSKVPIIFSVLLLVLLLFTLSVYLYFMDRIYPGLSVAQTDLTALTPSEAERKLAQAIQNRAQQSLTFTYQQSPQTSAQNFVINLEKSVSLEQIRSTTSMAWEFGHQKSYVGPLNLDLEISLSTFTQNQIDKIALEVNQPAIDSQLKFEGDQINVTPSETGFEVDNERVKQIIKNYLNSGKIAAYSLPIKPSYPKLSYETALLLKQKLDQIKQTPLKLTFKDQAFPIDFSTTTSLIDLSSTNNSLISTQFFGKTFSLNSITFNGQQIAESKLVLNSTKADEFVDKIASQIDRELQEPLFSFDPNSPNQTKVKEFRPPQEGRKLNRGLTKEKLSQALLNPTQTTIELPVDISQPKNKLTNELGIKELIGQGVSHFTGSITNRIYNVGLGASKINGILVPPGEEFSFDKTVGDVTAATGFKQAYIIKSGRTVLDDGGGICQVSTTLFRAALNAGLPITDRTAHAYRVGYYEINYPPGLDATVFYPSVDFKFKNETKHYILIQSFIEGETLYVNFYGTADGRVAILTKPIVTNFTPPPADIRQDDPTLPKGEVKQVEHAVAGATVVFSRTVTKNGQAIISDSYKSNYRPWPAVYLVGTKEG